MADSPDSARAPEIHSRCCAIFISRSINPATGLPAAGQRGPLYDVRHRGELLVERTTEPFLDGARALAARGLSGPLEMWDRERPFPRMRGIIEGAARLTVREGEQRPRFVMWTEHPQLKSIPARPVSALDGDSDGGGYHPTAHTP